MSQGPVTREGALCVERLPCFVMIKTFFALLILGKKGNKWKLQESMLKVAVVNIFFDNLSKEA